MPQRITSGDWRKVASMEDYRVERLSDILVERATWRADATLHAAPGAESDTAPDAAPDVAPVYICGQQVNQAGAVWFRFWLVLADRIVDKYFDADGVMLGMRVPICMPVESDGSHLRTVDLDLALWIGPEGQVTVINEDLFDEAAAAGVLTPQQVEYGEQAIRELTLAVAARKFPSALIRNFEMDLRTSS